MTLESRMLSTQHVRFGGGPSEKGPEHGNLAGGLPNRTPGSAGGQGKRAIHFEWWRTPSRPDSSTHRTIAFSGGAR
jgi:hypothetical protein